MLTDEQRTALDVALKKFIAAESVQKGLVNSVTTYAEAMFAAGIKFAQTQLAQARAEERAKAEKSV